MATEKLANNAKTTLNGAITSGATSLIVNSATAFPSGGNFRLLIEAELLLVTAVSTNTFTVTRGIEGTTAVAHADASPVYGIFTKGSFTQYITENTSQAVAGSGTDASKPAFGKTGSLWLPTDGALLELDNGSAWVPYLAPAFAVLAPPLVSALNKIDSGSDGTFTDMAGGGIFMSAPIDAGHDVKMLLKAIPASTWTLTVLVLPNLYPVAFSNAGIVIHETGSAGGKMTRFTVYVAAATMKCQVVHFATETAAAGTVVFDNVLFVGSNSPLWMRMQDDATKRRFSISTDGINFIELANENTGAEFTTGYVGLAVESLSANGPGTASYLSWKLTNP